MPNLNDALHTVDLGHLKIIARSWDVDLTTSEPKAALSELVKEMLSESRLRRLVNTLRESEQAAVRALTEAHGRLPWSLFVRRFGDIREMGPGRRDREQPYLAPASITEALWYRGLVARGFFDTTRGPEEHAYLGDDLLRLLVEARILDREGTARGSASALPLGRPARPPEYASVRAASDHVLDEATTWLSASRAGVPLATEPKLAALLKSAGLLGRGARDLKAVQAFLQRPRADALKWLIDRWREAAGFDELRMLPGLSFEGNWRSPTLQTRARLLGLVDEVPVGEWWNLPSFIQGLRETAPDFQRPAGDFDSWFIRRSSDSAYLRGIASWDEVEGSLVRYFIIDVLHWLGCLDIASPTTEASVTAFRRLEFGLPPSQPENGRLRIASNGRITAEKSLPRVARYHLGRFCTWLTPAQDRYQFRIDAASLTKARSQGLKAQQVLKVLSKYADGGVPPPIQRAISRWELEGAEVRVETQMVLRFRDPRLLERLRNSHLRRYLGELLGPTAIGIKAGAKDKVLAALAELGLLAEDITADVVAAIQAPPKSAVESTRTARPAKKTARWI